MALEVTNQNKIKPLELGTKSMLFRDKVQNHGWLAKISSVFRDAGEPRVCHKSEVKSEREKQISYMNAYIWNLEKWYWWTYYVQDRNRHPDLWTQQGEGRVGQTERVALTYTQSCVKQAGGKLLCNRELSSVLHDDLEEQDGGEAQQGRDMCIHTADSHCCTAETNMIL